LDERITREQALGALRGEREAWLTLVEEVGPERMEEPSPLGEWTFKDLAAHLTGWSERQAAMLEGIASGEMDAPVGPWPPELTEVQEINDWIYAANKDRPVDAVLAEAIAIYDRMEAALKQIPDETLNDTNLLPWSEGQPFAAPLIDGRLFGHLHEEHEAEVRAWLDGRNAEDGQ
jgi:uncharacterized protein (TIGR03083 family)